MRNNVLNDALKASLEDLEEQAANGELLETLVAEANDLDPQSYLAERLEVEEDVGTLIQEAIVIEESGAEVTTESLDAAVRLTNAVTGRYGFRMKDVSLESFGSPADRAPAVVEQMRAQVASLEAAVTTSLEAYTLGDLWNKLGLLNREIPELKDSIAVLGNYDGKARITMGPITQIFTVDGTLVENIPKAAADTAAILDSLLKIGESTIAVSQRAAAIAYAADWTDPDAADKALKQISGLHNSAKDAYTALDTKFVLGNRVLKVKKFAIKGGSDLGSWAEGASVSLSWPKSTTGQKLATGAGAAIGGMIGLVGGAIGAAVGAGYGAGLGASAHQVGQALKRRNIDIKELTAAFNKIKDSAVKSASIRNNAPKKWRDHELMVKKLKADVRGSTEAALAVRAISEQDRLGWECINAAFSILWFIVREINVLSASVVHKARKDQRD